MKTMRKRVMFAASWLNQHREWWLPVFTTFLGVFSAAALTIHMEKQKNFSRVNDIIKVARADLCASWGFVPIEVEIKNMPLKELPHSVPVPTIALSVLRDNASSLSEFNGEISTAAVKFVTDIRASGESYNFTLSKVLEFEAFEKLGEAISDPKFEALIDIQRKRLVSSAKENLSVFEKSVSELDFLLWLEFRRRNNELTEKEFNRLFASQTFENRCDDQD